MKQRVIFKDPIKIGELALYEEELTNEFLGEAYSGPLFNLEICADLSDDVDDSDNLELPINYILIDSNDTLAIRIINKISEHFNTYYTTEDDGIRTIIDNGFGVV